MTKGKSNIFKVVAVLVLLLLCQNILAQVEVVPLEGDKKVYYFDSLSEESFSMPDERNVPDSLVKRLQQDEAFWYANAQLQKEKKATQKNNVRLTWVKREWVRTFLWLMIIVLFAAVLIWYLSSLNIRLFRKRPTLIQKGAEEMESEDIFSIPFEKEIGKAIAAGNYTQTIRLYYLRTLSLLSQKNMIQFQQDRTNSVYVMQLHSTPFYKDFFNLTRNYEYTWYGRFELTKPQFTVVQKDFETFYQQLSA